MTFLRFDLPMAAERAAPSSPVGDPSICGVTEAAASPRRILREDELRRLERDNMLAALEQTGWTIYGPDGAAALLGIKPTTLNSRLRKHGLKRPRET